LMVRERQECDTTGNGDGGDWFYGGCKTAVQ